jgi:hypothetical protein
MIKVETGNYSKFLLAVKREGLILSYCSSDGEIFGHMYDYKGTHKGIGDVARSQGDNDEIFVTSHTDLGRIFVEMWEAGEY